MIRSFRHKGLSRLFAKGDQRGISSDLVSKCERVLARLDVAAAPEAMNLPGMHLHPLKGQSKGSWSVWVSGNWRIIFCFEGRDVADVDLVDYH